MQQKFVIGFSVVLVLLAVILIARDLFQETPSYTVTCSPDDEERAMKMIDPALIGYQQINVIETGLKDLTGVSVDENQQVFVCGKNQVTVFSSSGKKIMEFAIDSTANCIKVTDQHVYLAFGPQISQYSLNGTQISKWEAFNSNGYITSIAADNDFIYGADAISKRVLKYTINGEFVQEFGKKDPQKKSPGFIIPSLYFDIATGGFNDLWVVNPGYVRLENYSNDGKLRTSWGEPSFENFGFSGCCNPVHMALLPDGSFVTYEKGVDKVKLFSPAGQFQSFVAAAGSFKGESDFQLGHNKNLVKDMATDKTGLIYILDAYDRVCILKRTDSKSS
ncbi:MAG: hypothetical protein DWQ02_14725 [Bacteroidetes bacterium]|nr:MAG: hypothetical protein DWQ02_14725 [Bacteroidota bacterium]